MTNLCQDGISIFGKSDGINYCDFHHHGITIIPIYCPTLVVGVGIVIALGRYGFPCKSNHTLHTCMRIK